MSWVLLSNDDGVDSPALLPFAAALERALDLPVRVCVPDGERSWSGKAVTRFGTLQLRREVRDGRALATVDGTPADAVQLGLHAAFGAEFAGAPPQVVVTGINLGFNHGSAFLASSGTVWAAAEAAYAGLPAVAVSTGDLDDHTGWTRAAAAPASAAAWERVAGVAATTVRAIGDSSLHGHGDLWSVNLPWHADASTRRRVTSVAQLSYGPLFDPGDAPDTFGFRDRLDVRVDDVEGTDVGAVRAGHVSVTPLVLPSGAAVPDDARRAFET